MTSRGSMTIMVACRALMRFITSFYITCSGRTVSYGISQSVAFGSQPRACASHSAKCQRSASLRNERFLPHGLSGTPTESNPSFTAGEFAFTV